MAGPASCAIAAAPERPADRNGRAHAEQELLVAISTGRAAPHSNAESAGICLDPPPGGPAEPIMLHSATSWPAYGSNSWLPRHKLASPLIFDP